MSHAAAAHHPGPVLGARRSSRPRPDVVSRLPHRTADGRVRRPGPPAAPNGGSRPPPSREKSLRAFDFEANPSVDPAVIHTLATCEWVKKGMPLCLIGDSGTGKSRDMEPAPGRVLRAAGPRRAVPDSQHTSRRRLQQSPNLPARRSTPSALQRHWRRRSRAHQSCHRSRTRLRRVLRRRRTAGALRAPRLRSGIRRHLPQRPTRLLLRALRQQRRRGASPRAAPR